MRVKIGCGPKIPFTVSVPFTDFLLKKTYTTFDFLPEIFNNLFSTFCKIHPVINL